MAHKFLSPSIKTNPSKVSFKCFLSAQCCYSFTLYNIILNTINFTNDLAPYIVLFLHKLCNIRICDNKGSQYKWGIKILVFFSCDWLFNFFLLLLRSMIWMNAGALLGEVPMMKMRMQGKSVLTSSPMISASCHWYSPISQLQQSATMDCQTWRE